MNDNTNKTAVVAAIWQDPARVFGVPFRQSGRYLENQRGGDYGERGKIRLLSVADGANITVFYNGASRPEKCDVFTYLADFVLHTSGFRETLERCATLYGLTLQYTNEEREALGRQQLAREVAPSLIEALRANPSGAAGRYLTNVRGLNIDNHFGELTDASIQRAVEGLKMRGKAYNPDDFKALGLTVERANAGYNLVIPYRTNGVVTGFAFRNVKEQHNGPKYLYSTGMKRGAYCDALPIGEPVVFAEGMLDAVRLTQSGVKNVVAMGGAQLTDQAARLLRSRGIEQITYVPDNEVDTNQHPDTGLVRRAVGAFLTAQVDGEPVVKNLYVATLPNPEDWTQYPKYKDGELKGYKIDADTYGKVYGAAALAEAVEMDAAPWWGWELDELLRWAKDTNAAEGTVNISAFQSKFDAIYNRIANPYERERCAQYVTTHDRAIFNAFGVTPQALNNRDEWNRNRDYNNRVKAAAVELSKAVENGANPSTVGEIVAKLADAQTTNTRDEWERQLNETFADELDAIRNQPDTLTTKWVLGNLNPQRQFIPYEKIEFWPADITVFCAPTSHGKTMILFQSALDLVRTTNKTYLFVSCEENKRQLTERALNAFIDIENTPDGKTATGEPCFISGTRKRTIKAIIRNAAPPQEYTFLTFEDNDDYDRLTAHVNAEINRYAEQVRPRLKFVHSDATAESITANVNHTVDDLRAAGVEVGGVFVDYMQLLTSDGKNFSRTDELKGVCKALKSCAARLEIPVIIAAQLNRAVLADGIDAVTVANIGEGADIERIAHDIYFVWQVDKTKKDRYFRTEAPKGGGEAVTKWNYTEAKDRANRIFTHNDLFPDQRELKRGYIYVEQMKARDGKTDGWGLFPFDGERGYIGENDKTKMAE